MSLLIAVTSCHAGRRQCDAQRATWLKDSPYPVRFFVGRAKLQNPPLPDEIQLQVPDDYLNLSHKVQAMVRWARANGFSHVLKCDDDVYLRPERLAGLESEQYVGMNQKHSMCSDHPYNHGGAGYLLGGRAVHIVADAPSPVCTVTSPDRSEDGWIANLLWRHGIPAKHDARFRYTRRIQGDLMPETPTKSNAIVTCAEFSAAEMAQVHKLWRTSLRDGVDVEAMSAAEYRTYLRNQERRTR
jgi:hypothetical protein